MDFVIASSPLRRQTLRAVVDYHGRADRNHLAELFGGEHGYANAAVARRVRGDGRAAVDGEAAAEVVRVVEQPERAQPPAVNLPLYREAAARRVRALQLSLVE